MYGLLLENLSTFIRTRYSENVWQSVRKTAGIDTISFSTHYVYSESLFQRLAKSTFQVLEVDEKQFFEDLGVFFVQYVSQYGYDKILSLLGRQLRDFLNGLDNLHEYLKFSYPKMRAPSFYCDDETISGLKLHYRSKRREFVYYVMGQIKQVAIQFYHQECRIELVSKEIVGEAVHVVFQLYFDNSAFIEEKSLRNLVGQNLDLFPVQAATLFDLFPFCIVFNSEMEIIHTGNALMLAFPHLDLVGQIINEAFDMTRPLIQFSYNEIMQRRNNVFELTTISPLGPLTGDGSKFSESFSADENFDGFRLRLRGQMLYMEEWTNLMIYFCNPVMPDLNSLVNAGLFINDLSLHDCSRDLVLAGTQQSVELKLALDQEQQKSLKLTENVRKLDEEMRKTDELLYQMIPKEVADRIRNGENPVDTCQTFDMVSILFSDVVNFTDICSKITPMQVVCMLNHIYSLFDQLTSINGVYKVETIGDSYMVVSGCPVKDLNHAERICDMALDMKDASAAIEDPSQCSTSLAIRVGCHSGTVVGGVVGVKMPRYCLFGDTVNTASRMESTSESSKIQISEVCKNLLPDTYELEFRGTVSIKGKGLMNTYFLNGRSERVPLSKFCSKSIIWSAPSTKNDQSNTTTLQASKSEQIINAKSLETPATLNEDTSRNLGNPVSTWQKLQSSNNLQMSKQWKSALQITEQLNPSLRIKKPQLKKLPTICTDIYGGGGSMWPSSGKAEVSQGLSLGNSTTTTTCKNPSPWLKSTGTPGTIMSHPQGFQGLYSNINKSLVKQSISAVEIHDTTRPVSEQQIPEENENKKNPPVKISIPAATSNQPESFSAAVSFCCNLNCNTKCHRSEQQSKTCKLS